MKPFHFYFTSMLRTPNLKYQASSVLDKKNSHSLLNTSNMKLIYILPNFYCLNINKDMNI